MRETLKREKWQRYVAPSLAVLFFAAVLSARAEEGGGSSTESTNEIFKWINFAIVAAVLIWLSGSDLAVRKLRRQ